MNCVWRHQGEGYVASSVQREIDMTTLPLTHRAQASVATNHGTHLASWALISRAWYPDTTAAHPAQGIFLLMYIGRPLKSSNSIHTHPVNLFNSFSAKTDMLIISDRVHFSNINSLNLILFSQLTGFGKLSFFNFHP